MATCFYCGVSLIPKSEWFKNGRRNNDDDHTIDHIYPKTLINYHHRTQAVPLTPKFHNLNEVGCCRACNNYKGQLHPLDWLVIMEYPENAARLAERMIAMGEEMDEVFDALRRRKRK